MFCEKEFNEPLPRSAHMREDKGTAGGGGGAERGRGERRDRGRSDKGEHDEKGATARWHEGRSENRRETAKRDRKRRTPKGGRRLAHHTPLLKIPVWWRRAVLPSLPWVVRFLSFFLYWARDWRALALTHFTPGLRSGSLGETRYAGPTLGDLCLPLGG